MGAAGFGTLASHFTEWSPRPTRKRAQPADRADGPAVARAARRRHPSDHPGSRRRTGRPVRQQRRRGNALVLVALYPEDVLCLVAHEPPLPTLLPDREAALAASGAVNETYRQGGWGAGMAHFIALVSHRGEFTADFARQPAPDPAMFGLPTEDDGSRTDPLLGLALVGSIGYEPDFEALRAAFTRVVMAAGAEWRANWHAVARSLWPSA